MRSQLENGLREAIRTGRLHAGERLPSSRELARQLGVSRGLVQECYGQLHAEGYLSARVGSATRVATVGTTPVGTTPVIRKSLPEGTHLVVATTRDGRVKRFRVRVRAGKLTVKQIAFD